MGLYNVTLKEYTHRDGSPIRLAHNPRAVEIDDMLSVRDNVSRLSIFETKLIGRVTPLDFSIKKINENKLVGEAHHESMLITKTMSIDPDTYTFQVDIKVSNITIKFLGLTTYLSDYMEPILEQSFFMPRFGGQDFFALTAEGKERTFVADMEESTYNFNAVSIAALGNQYFSQGNFR